MWLAKTDTKTRNTAIPLRTNQEAILLVAGIENYNTLLLI